MSLHDLIGIAPPPAEPVLARGDWGEVQRALGLRLPEDFKELIENYGSGSFADFLNVINPFWGGTGLLRASESILGFDRDFRSEFPEELPFPIHPESGGLFPWATTDNGDTLYWLTEGDPHAWGVMVRESRGPDRAVYPYGAVEFLYQWLSGAIACPVFPIRDKYFDPEFAPTRVLCPVTIYLAHVDGPYEERLRRLMDYFGSKKVKKRVASQCVFQVEPSGSKVTYSEIGGGHGSCLALAFPPENECYFKDRVGGLPERLGWLIRKIRGMKEDFWDDVPRISQ